METEAATVAGTDGTIAVDSETVAQVEETPPATRVLGPSCIKYERIEWKLRTDEVVVGNEHHELKGALQNAIMYKGIKEVDALIRAGAPLGAEYPFYEDGHDVRFGTALDIMMIQKRFKLALSVLDLDITQFAQATLAQPEALCDEASPDAVAVDASDVPQDATEAAPQAQSADESNIANAAAAAVSGGDVEGEGAPTTANEQNNVQACEAAAAAAAAAAEESQETTQVERLVDGITKTNVDSSLSIGQRLARASTRAFVLAARDGKAEIVQKLIELNASMSQFDRDGKTTALLLAAQRGQKNCVDVLLHHGAISGEPRANEVKQWMEHFKMTEAQQKAIRDQAAADKENLAIQTEKHWANTTHERPTWYIDEGTKQGPLAYAIINQSVKDVKLAIQQGGALVAEYPLTGIDRPMGNALDLALQHRRFQLAAFMLKEPQAEALAKQCVFALAWAALEKRVEIVQEMLQLGANPCQCDEAGRSALLLASMRGHGQCVALLIAANAWSGEQEQGTVREWVAHWKLTVPIP